MANFLQVKTLESDDEVSEDYEDEDDEEEEKQKLKKGKKKSKVKTAPEFDNDFNFDVGQTENPIWKIDEAVKSKAKGLVSSEHIEEKIQKKRKERKKRNAKKGKVDEEEEEDQDNADKENADVTVEEESGADDDKENNEKSNEIDEEDEKDEAAAVEDSEDEDEDEDEDDGDDDDEDDDDEEEEKEFFLQPPPQVKHETFTQMNLSRPLLRAVNELGFLHPTQIQSSTIPIALLGKDICACATTGSGKTAAFMLPILERLLFKPKQNPTTRVLVLVPTRELAIQVHSVTQSLSKYSNIHTCLAAGGLDLKSQEAALRQSPDIVIATPGRLIDHLHNAPSFDLQMIEILVLDEADRMLEEHFADQLKELIRLCPRGRQTMLFSATMTDEVEELTVLSLNQPIKLFIDHNTDVAKNLHQEFVRIRANRENDRLAIVASLCCRSFKEHALIFLQTKRLAHKLRILLGLLGLNVAELHGDLTMLQRLEALEKFKNSEADILVCTDLAARGLDVVGVKTVISFNMPTTVKSYIHRVGRTARAGKAGRSITLVGEKERKMLKGIVKSSHVPVKNRIIPPDVIERYKKKIEDLEKDIKDILKQEETEKQLRIADMQVNKAQNLIVHHDEIMSRPARTFIKPEKKQSDKKDAKKKDTKKKKNGPEDEEFAKLKREQEFQRRCMKREKKPKRKRAYEEKDDAKPNKGSKKPKMQPMANSFSRELTDTSRKNLQSLRSNPHQPKKKKAGFKSKGKHRRR